jgi:hypothetical protein
MGGGLAQGVEDEDVEGGANIEDVRPRHVLNGEVQRLAGGALAALLSQTIGSGIPNQSPDDNDEAEEKKMPLSVIGAGLGRTGTLSLKLALEQLDFGPCYHMREVFERHLADHVPLWTKAARGEPVDWSALFGDYRSAVDFPAAAFYREIADHFPSAKVILTVRDSDRWYESFSNTIRHPLTEALPDNLEAWGEMVRKAILDRVFGGDAMDRSHVIASYERHNEQVKRTVPFERLLVYEVADGWEPLCNFRVPVPKEPYPKVNTTDEFRKRIATHFKR